MLVGARASTSIRHFTESDGLPQSLITCVMQDSKGYIWISSWNGLSCYDGYSFSNFKARQGDNCPLVTNRILFIREVAGGDRITSSPSLPHFRGAVFSLPKVRRSSPRWVYIQ